MSRFSVAVIMLVTIGIVSAGEAEAVTWSFVSANQKVFPDTEIGDRHSVILHAARGEYVSIQIALRSEQDELLDLAVDMPAEIFECKYIDTPGVAAWGFPDEERYSDLRREVYPDPLLPVTEIALESGVTRSLWLRVQAEEPQTITVEFGEERAEIELEVWPFALPETPTLRTAIGLGGAGFARIYDTEIGSERYHQLYSRYYEALLQYRLSGYRPPWGVMDERGQQYLIDPRVTSFILPYSGDPDRMREIWRQLTALGIADWGWFYNIDEPTTLEEYETVKGQVNYLRRVAPGADYGLPFYTGLPDGSTPFDHLADFVSMWMIQTDYYHHGHGLGDRVRRQATERFDAGDEIWLYTAHAPRVPFCNILLNNTALQHRLLFWQVYAEHIATGYIYWSSTYWDQTDDPWTDIATVKNIDGHVWGDGSLFYPGLAEKGHLPEDGPIGSIRLEAIRAGLQDHDLLMLAEQVWGRERAQQLARRMVPSLVDYVTDHEEFAAFRVELGRRLAAEPRAD